MKKQLPTAASYAKGLIRQEDKHRRFWTAYMNASQGGYWTNAMLAHAQDLQQKTANGTGLFLDSMRPQAH